MQIADRVTDHQGSSAAGILTKRTQTPSVSFTRHTSCKVDIWGGVLVACYNIPEHQREIVLNYKNVISCNWLCWCELFFWPNLLAVLKFKLSVFNIVNLCSSFLVQVLSIWIARLSTICMRDWVVNVCSVPRWHKRILNVSHNVWYNIVYCVQMKSDILFFYEVIKNKAWKYSWGLFVSCFWVNTESLS